MFTLHNNHSRAARRRSPSSPLRSRATVYRIDRGYVFAFPAQDSAAELVYPAGTTADGFAAESTQLLEKGRVEE
jgi:hypothetical protein